MLKFFVVNAERRHAVDSIAVHRFNIYLEMPENFFPIMRVKMIYDA